MVESELAKRSDSCQRASGSTDQAARDGATGRIARHAANERASAAADQGAAELAILAGRFTTREAQGHDGHHYKLLHHSLPDCATDCPIRAPKGAEMRRASGMSNRANALGFHAEGSLPEDL